MGVFRWVLIVAPLLALAAFGAPQRSSARAEGAGTATDALSFQVLRDGVVATVRIDMILADRGPAANDRNLRAARQAILARFPDAVVSAPGEVTAAYVLNPYSWPARRAAWGYNAAGGPPGLTGARAALMAATATWSDAGADFRFTGGGVTNAGTGACHGATDGANTVGWAEQADAVLAITCAWYGGGVATEFDMEFDPAWEWTTTVPVRFDLQSVATHEFGHALGLAHSPLGGTVMYASYAGGTTVRSLTDDDLAAVVALYGRAGGVSGATALALSPGANLLTWAASDREPGSLTAGQAGLTAIYAYDAVTGQWLRYVPGASGYVNTLKTLRPGMPYWFLATSAVSLPLQP
ncbi:MAG: matrixin family metalloprotease [Dehalococcoidia bacterium]|nr:matrixin family metalloprotease [Dehalococcoidia bacterium]